MNRQAKPTPMPVRVHGRVLALCVGVICALLLVVMAELVARIVFTKTARLTQTWIPDSDLIYLPNPQAPDTPGSFRGRSEFTPGSDYLRIVCMGGSTTFGFSVQRVDSWPAQAESTLCEQGLPSEVINAGVLGHGSRQLLLRYRRDIAGLEGDVVILFTGWNRTGALVDSREWVPHGIVREGDAISRRLASLCGRHSLLCRRFIQAASARIGRHEWAADPYPDVFFSDVATLVRDITKQGQIPVVVVYPTLLYEDMSPHDIETFQPLMWRPREPSTDSLLEIEQKHRALREIATESQAIIIDVQRYYERFNGADRSRLFLDEMHPSVEGNEVIGTVVGRALAAAFAERRADVVASSAFSANPEPGSLTGSSSPWVPR